MTISSSRTGLCLGAAPLWSGGAGVPVFWKANARDESFARFRKHPHALKEPPIPVHLCREEISEVVGTHKLQVVACCDLHKCGHVNEVLLAVVDSFLKGEAICMAKWARNRERLRDSVRRKDDFIVGIAKDEAVGFSQSTD
eukprot:scaffold200515_cov33-Tisochrysis_lutea.AAC.1